MRWRTPWPIVVAPLALLPVGACGGPAAPKSAGTPPALLKSANPGVAEADPSDAAGAPSRGAVFVPVYPYVYTADDARPFNLAVTLYVRNTDPASPLFLTSVREFDAAGKPARDFVKAPLRVAPMASATFFVKESDVAAGSSASLLVDWSGAEAIREPAVEAVMVGTLMNQGVALTSAGRPVAPASKPR